MKVFKISNSKLRLPSISKWIDPNYTGIEDEFTDSTPPRNLPKNWKKDFPAYVYNYPNFEELKSKLNTAKHQLNPITDVSRQKYDNIVEWVRPYNQLKGNKGILVKTYGAEIVTNAWLKMFELLVFLHPQLSKLNQSKKESKTFNSFHIAEAPGNFILAINHKIQTDYVGVEWNWLANTYRDLYTGSNYLSDQYGIIAKYPDRWIFGADGDGDITSPENIVSFSQTIREKFRGSLQFITSDVKYVPEDNNFDEEERINLPVHLGHILSSLLCLSKGGTMILKQFTLFEAPSISMLYLVSCCFQDIYIAKPVTSRTGNSEIYIVGTGYKRNLSVIQIERLLKIMRYIRFLNTEVGSPSIFLQEDIPSKFIEEVYQIESQLTDSQISGINKNIELFGQYSETGHSGIKKDLGLFAEKITQQWIKKNNIKHLDPRHSLIAHHGESTRGRST